MSGYLSQDDSPFAPPYCWKCGCDHTGVCWFKLPPPLPVDVAPVAEESA